MDEIVFTTNDNIVETNKLKEIKMSFNGKDNYRMMPYNLYLAIMKADLTGAELKLIYYVYDRTFGYDDNKDNKTDPTSFYYLEKILNKNYKSFKRAAQRLYDRNVMWIYDGGIIRGHQMYCYQLNPHFDTWNDCGLEDYVKYELEHQPARMAKIKERKKQLSNPTPT